MHHYHLAFFLIFFNNYYVFTLLVERSHTADSEHLYDFTLFPVWKEEEIKQIWRNLSSATFTRLIIGKIFKERSTKSGLPKSSNSALHLRRDTAGFSSQTKGEHECKWWAQANVS